MTTNDYSSLEAGPELDVLVAKKRGWRVVDLNDNAGGLRVKGPNWELVTPEGVGMGVAWREADAWKHPDLPAYSADLNAAIVLLKDIENGGLTPDNDGWYAGGFVDGVGVVAEVTKPTPALAVCVSWLMYRDWLGQ